MMMRRWVIVVLVVAASMPLSRCWAQSPVTLEQRFSANDSLAIGDRRMREARVPGTSRLDSRFV
ncbi:MAG: hypothetical protein R3B96_14295 [Pirellulaceae bacterium]